MRTTTSVILAAGSGVRLGEDGKLIPKGFVEVDGAALVERSIRRLVSAGMERVVIVTGHRAHHYDSLAKKHRGLVETLHNPLHASSGTMQSLYCARERVDGDFLLLESDLLYEQRALTATLGSGHADVVLTTGFSDVGDEVWVDAPGGRLRAMSKERADLREISGVLVGICKISR
jgi:2-aminoethylphosphonate-pyruvate transaminase